MVSNDEYTGGNVTYMGVIKPLPVCVEKQHENISMRRA